MSHPTTTTPPGSDTAGGPMSEAFFVLSGTLRLYDGNE
jgi:hypothetical protein